MGAARGAAPRGAGGTPRRTEHPARPARHRVGRGGRGHRRPPQRPAGPRPQGPRVRTAGLGILRLPVGGLGLQRHGRAAPGRPGPGHRAGGLRGHHLVLVHRVVELPALRGRRAGVPRHRPRHPVPVPGPPPRVPRRVQGRRRGPARPPLWSPGRRRGGRGGGVLSEQADHHRRGRDGPGGRSRPRGAHPEPPEPGSPDGRLVAPPLPAGVQLPAGRDVGGARRGPDAPGQGHPGPPGAGGRVVRGGARRERGSDDAVRGRLGRARLVRRGPEGGRGPRTGPFGRAPYGHGGRGEGVLRAAHPSAAPVRRAGGPAGDAAPRHRGVLSPNAHRALLGRDDRGAGRAGLDRAGRGRRGAAPMRLRRAAGNGPTTQRPLRLSLQAILTPTGSKRTLFFLTGDLLVFAGSLLVSFLIRFDAQVPDVYWAAIPAYFLIAVVPKVVSNAAFRLYHLTWRFVSTREIIQVFLATLVGSAVFGTAAFLLRDAFRIRSLPRSILVLDFVMSFFGVAGLRMAKRIYQVVTLGGRADGRRVLVVGGGRAGERLLRELRHDRESGYRPVGVVDDSAIKHGTYLHGVRVLGGRSVIPRVVKDERVDEVIVAMPSAPGPVIREVVVLARQAGVPSVRILPGVAAMLEGRVTLASVRDVQVEDLLKRPAVEIDMTSVGEYLYGRTVLITGAAGSIGAELTRQIARVEPGRLLLLEKDETRLFGLEIDLRRVAPRVPVFPIVGDVRDRARMHQVFLTYQPQVVFHAAAYKHVPMMEAHPQEAVTVNILGTKVTAEVAAEAGVEMFVLISTDKAVNPTSVMGATKRVAEMLVRRLNEAGATRFVAVRFGNVLGSRGSLIPLLEEQIRRGGPMTVTDPAMERYFMTIPEAVRLLLKASTLGTGGEAEGGDPPGRGGHAVHQRRQDPRGEAGLRTRPGRAGPGNRAARLGGGGGRAGADPGPAAGPGGDVPAPAGRQERRDPGRAPGGPGSGRPQGPMISP